jgi:cytochrome c553
MTPMPASMKLIPALLLVASLALPMTAAAKGDIEAGRQKSQVCQACHGPDGNGTGDGQYPRLAGQHADYLLKALRDYKSGARENAIMAGFVSTLESKDLEDLSAFYAAQTGPLTDLSNLR